MKQADEISAYFESIVFTSDCEATNIPHQQSKSLAHRILSRLGYIAEVESDIDSWRLLTTKADGSRFGPYVFASKDSRERYRTYLNERSDPTVNILYADPGSNDYYDPTPR
jgi:hypothetical protein